MRGIFLSTTIVFQILFTPASFSASLPPIGSDKTESSFEFSPDGEYLIWKSVSTDNNEIVHIYDFKKDVQNIVGVFPPGFQLNWSGDMKNIILSYPYKKDGSGRILSIPIMEYNNVKNITPNEKIQYKSVRTGGYDEKIVFEGRVGSSRDLNLYSMHADGTNLIKSAEGKDNTLIWFVDFSGQPLARLDYDRNNYRNFTLGIYDKENNIKREIPMSDRVRGLVGLSIFPADYDGKTIWIKNSGFQGPPLQRINIEDGSVLEGFGRDDEFVNVSFFSPDNRDIILLQIEGGYPYIVENQNIITNIITNVIGTNKIRVNYIKSDKKRNRFILEVAGEFGIKVFYIDKEKNYYKVIHQTAPIESKFWPASVQIPVEDGLFLRSYLYLDPQTNDSHPLLVRFRGDIDSRKTWGADWFTRRMVTRGFSVLNIDIRGTVGYGEPYSRAGAANYMNSDIDGIMRWIAEQKSINKKEIILLGDGVGGRMAIMAARKYNCISNLVLMDPVVEFSYFLENLKNFKSPDYEMYREYFHGWDGDDNVTQEISEVQSEILLMNGISDRTFPIESSRKLSETLKLHKKKFSFIEIDDAKFGEISLGRIAIPALPVEDIYNERRYKRKNSCV
jgi:dipeptidyl aminopeptidase/acylaminoacyl peptidase